VDLDEYRRSSLDTWHRVSPNWESERDFVMSATMPVSERIVDRADPKPGDTVLDVAAGTGDTGFLAADRVGHEGRLVSTDFAPGMVEAAERNGDAQGLKNVEYRVLDAENMDLDDDSFDRVVSRFGYMLMAEPARALAETRRVLRDGGRLAFAVWAGPEENMWAAIPGMSLVERGVLPPPEPGAPGIFAMADPARIRELVTGAGFGEPEIEQVEVAWTYGDPDVHWEMTLKLAGPLSGAVRELDEAEQEAVREEVRARIEPLMDSSGVRGLTHVVTAE
jgi:SAM-dependent methyltransferase